jgi:hypothetical protein
MDWKTNYKSMSFDQLLEVKMPFGLSAKERNQRMAFIAAELQIKATNCSRDPQRFSPPEMTGTSPVNTGNGAPIQRGTEAT